MAEFEMPGANGIGAGLFLLRLAFDAVTNDSLARLQADWQAVDVGVWCTAIVGDAIDDIGCWRGCFEAIAVPWEVSFFCCFRPC